MSFSPTSLELTKELSKEEKKNNGIFFTPSGVVKKILEEVRGVLKDKVIRVLEPSVGSGEFVDQILAWNTEVSVFAVEKNPLISAKLAEQYQGDPRVKLSLETDFLASDLEKDFGNQKFDLIIGNPPYFVVKKNQVDRQFFPYFSGRPNIFLLFLVKCLGWLANQGLLAFVLPRSFLNCLYYDKTRQFIFRNFRVVRLLDYEDLDGSYLDTDQETIVLIIQKSVGEKANNLALKNLAYSLRIANYLILGKPERIRNYRRLLRESQNLDQLGFQVSVGNVVWNQVKDLLTDDSTQTRLIYSSDIKNNQLELTQFRDTKKKNYIRQNGVREICLVINRGYGMGKYQFSYCLIDLDVDYLIENHLIVVRPKDKRIDEESVRERYRMIIRSLEKAETKEFVEGYFGNNAINTVELNFILPIYPD